MTARPSTLGFSQSARGIRDRVKNLTQRVPRAVRWVAWVLFAIYVAYLAVANVLLSTNLLRSWLDTDPQSLEVRYRAAWSLFPGRVQVRDFTLRFQDDNVQSYLTIERASFTVDLAALPRHVFRARGVEASGVTMLLRHKLDAVAGQEGRIAAYPAIPGYADPPLRTPSADLPIPDSEYDKWAIDLDDVVARVRELWIMEYRYQGDGTASGGFFIKPVREVVVRSSTLITHGGTLQLGKGAIVAPAEGRIEAVVERHDPRLPKGIEVFRHVTATVDLQGKVVEAEPFAATYMRESGVGLRGGAGDSTIDARLDNGIFTPDTRVEYRTADIVADVSDVLTVRGDAALLVHVEAIPHEGSRMLSLAAEITTDHAGVSPLSRDPAHEDAASAITVRTGRASVDLGNADVTKPFGLAKLGLAIGSARAPDLRRLSPLLPPKASFEGGSAAAALRFAYDRGALEGRADLTLEGAKLETPKMAITTTANVWTVAAARDVEEAMSFAGSGADLTGVSVRLDDTREDGLWARLRLPDAKIAPRAASAATKVTLEAGPGAGMLRLLAGTASLPKELGDVAAGSKLEAHARIEAKPGLLDVVLERATNGAFEATGRLRKEQKNEGGARGAFLLSAGPFRAGLAIHCGSVSVVPFASRGWLAERTGVASQGSP